MQKSSDLIAKKLRHKIISGEWEPGLRIPTRKDIVNLVDSNATVVQQAITTLVEEGFLVVGAAKKGTTVAKNPPHQSQYRIIFPNSENENSLFSRAVKKAIADRKHSQNIYSYFSGFNKHDDIEQYNSLCDEVVNHKIAGLIFITSSKDQGNIATLSQSKLPKVAISNKGDFPGIPKLCLDLDSFIHAATQYLSKQGKKKVAFICPDTACFYVDSFRRYMKEFGLKVQSKFEQFPSIINTMVIKHLIELLFDANQTEQPDSLIIMDDNLIEGVDLALKKLTTPTNLEVVACSNFPNLVKSDYPMTHFGFDIPAIIDLLTKNLENISLGKKVPHITKIKAIHENDFFNKI